MRSARREQGVLEVVGPYDTITRSTMTCCHCNTVSIIETGTAPDDCGGFCRLCMKPTCKACAGQSCTPFERRLEAIERRGRLLASLGL